MVRFTSYLSRFACNQNIILNITSSYHIPSVTTGGGGCIVTLRNSQCWFGVLAYCIMLDSVCFYVMWAWSSGVKHKS